MTKQELIDQDHEHFTSSRNLINLIPEDWDIVSSVDSTCTLYCKEQDLWEDCIKRLHLLSQTFGKYTLERYYHSYSGLAMSYEFPDTEVNDRKLRIVIYCQEEKLKALEVVGKGKCRIEESYSTPYKTKEVVCDLT